MPQISVVIPTYNRQHLVQQTIDSVLQQTFSDWELIVVDDGSTDDSRRVLEKRYGSRIRYVYQCNQGESVARNLGVELATGDYVAFLDSDDLWHPDKLKRQIEVMEKHPDVALVGTQAHWINFEGWRLRLPPHGHDQKSNSISWADLVLNNVVAGGGSSALVRRACLANVGGFDPEIRFGEEWDLWIRIARHYGIWQIPEPLVFFRVHSFGTRSWAPRADEAKALYSEHRIILEKAFADCPYEPAECADLKATALSHIYLREAIVNCAIDNCSTGSAQWLTALRLCPQHATDHTMMNRFIVQYVNGYASLAKQDSQISEIGRLLDLILANAPPEMLLTAERHSLWSRCVVEMAFLAAYNKKTKLARRAAYHSLKARAASRKNLGLWKILVTGGRHLWPAPFTIELT
jgi:GT2 family glycosyltransferase